MIKLVFEIEKVLIFLKKMCERRIIVNLSYCEFVICEWVLSFCIIIFVNDGLKVGGWENGPSKVNGLVKKEKNWWGWKLLKMSFWRIL
jgi:hypothetical protein